MSPIPTQQQIEWQQMERSMFVHYGPAAWQGREYDNGTTPLSEINPKQLDTDQWCEAALSWGAKMIIFVAKHVGGFCWWQTDTTEYSVKNTPWRSGKGDVLADLSASCKKFGLKLGVYIYPGDDSWGAYLGGGGKTEDPARQEAYNKVYRQQLTEVLTRYGEIFEVWFDGSCIIEMEDILKDRAPGTIVFQSPHANIRWCGNEEGELPRDAWSTLDRNALESGVATAVQSDPDGNAWAPLEADTTLYDHFWFWSPEKEKKRKSLEHLLRIYYQSVGRGGVLLLNSSPDITGRIPERDMALYREFGAELKRRFDNPVAVTAGEGKSVTLTLAEKTAINHAVVGEGIRGGERVRSYRLEAQTENGWILLAEGRHIGHKKIFVFPAVETDCLRLTVAQAKDIPLIAELSAYFIQSEDFESLLALQKKSIVSYDPVTGRQIEFGTGQTACRWTIDQFQEGVLDLTVDLTSFVPRAGQYFLSLLPETGEAMQVLSATGILEGIRTEGIVFPIKENESYNLTRTAAIEKDGGQTTGIQICLQMKKPCGGAVVIKPAN